MVADFELDRNDFPSLVAAPWADGDHLSLRRLLFGGIRNNDSACGLIVGADARNDDAVVKRQKLHINLPKSLFMLSFLTKKRSSRSKYERGPVFFNWPAFSTRQVRLPARHPQLRGNTANALNLGAIFISGVVMAQLR